MRSILASGEESMFGRRSTREIAVAAEATATARYEAAEAHRKGIEETLVAHQLETTRMHVENKGDIANLRQSISRVHQRIDGLIWKIISWQAALMIIGLGIMGYLLANGIPWEHTKVH